MSSQKSSLNNTSRITHEFCGTQKLGNVLGCFCFFFLSVISCYIYTAQTLSSTTLSNFYFTGVYFLSSCLSFALAVIRILSENQYVIILLNTISQYKHNTNTKWQLTKSNLVLIFLDILVLHLTSNMFQPVFCVPFSGIFNLFIILEGSTQVNISTGYVQMLQH